MHDPSRGTGPARVIPQHHGGSPQMRSDSNPGYGSEQPWNSQPPQQMPPSQHRVSDRGTHPSGGPIVRPMQPSSRRSWVILAVLMLAGLGAGMLIALQGG
jgi:hypothetical protein